jgi:hypothetical protein
MSLYILGCVLIAVGLYLSAHQNRDQLRDIWAAIFIVIGLLLIAARVIVNIWRLM